jgi:hypothetical protein
MQGPARRALSDVQNRTIPVSFCWGCSVWLACFLTLATNIDSKLRGNAAVRPSGSDDVMLMLIEVYASAYLRGVLTRTGNRLV